MSYFRFGAMILTSTIVMFGLMYLNTYAWEHVFYSETRIYMAVVMGSVMAVVMLSFMWAMYRHPILNWAIMAAAVIVFAGALWLVRSQVTVGDLSYMRAMIPHHSIAIMTSKRAEISDPRVRKLADEIIAAQEKEIAEMRFLIDHISENGDAGDDWPLGNEPARISTLDEALASAEIAVLDPEPLSSGEIERGLDGDATCRFQRSVDSDPVLVASAGGDSGGGLMKLSGQLVRLAGASGSAAPAPVYEADGARLSIATEDGEDEATLLFELDRGLRVGYDGYWRC